MGGGFDEEEDENEISIGRPDSDSDEDPAADDNNDGFDISTSEQEVSNSAALDEYDYKTSAMPSSAHRDRRF